MSPKTVYITGGASGIGRAVAETLHARGMRIAIADRNLAGAKEVCSALDSSSNAKPDRSSLAVEVDVSSWESQVDGFTAAIKGFGRIDIVIVNAGIGERVFVPNDGGQGTKFVKPDLTILDVDLTGFLYTAALAIQQMRRQAPDREGFRGKIVGTASVCGFYCVPTLPVYTAAKHGAVGFVRSYGKYLPEEKITLNAVCPHVLRTGISTGVFYDSLEDKGLLTPMKTVVDAFESLIDGDASGECLEAGPVGGFTLRAAPEVLNKECQKLNEMLYLRGHALHEAKQ